MKALSRALTFNAKNIYIYNISGSENSLCYLGQKVSLTESLQRARARAGGVYTTTNSINWSLVGFTIRWWLLLFCDVVYQSSVSFNNPMLITNPRGKKIKVVRIDKKIYQAKTNFVVHLCTKDATFYFKKSHFTILKNWEAHKSLKGKFSLVFRVILISN